MVMNEWFDIFDAHQQPLGKAERSDVHKKGYWHHTFHCWFYRIENDCVMLLFQLRQMDKDLFANCLDISAAGHLASGETVEDGFREVEEELGIHISPNQVKKIGMIPDAIEGSTFIDNEYAHVFAYDYTSLNKDKFTIDPVEVADLFEIPLAHFKSIMLQNTTQRIQSLHHPETILQVNKSDFVPHCASYYEQLLAYFEA